MTNYIADFTPAPNLAPSFNGDYAEKQKHYLYKFDSITELASTINQIPASQQHDSRSEADDYETNGFSQRQSIDLALSGGHWDEGAEGMLQAEVPENHALDGLTMRRNITTEFAGFMPNIPAYLSGEAENMFMVNTTPRKHKLIKIGINAARAWFIKDKETLNLGRAILAATEQLQKAGYAVEIDVVWYCSKDTPTGPRHKGTIKNPLVEIVTTIKQAHEHFSPASMAFAVSSTAFCRRLCWRILESIAPLKEFCDHGYGIGVDLINDNYDLWVPYLASSNEKYVSTPEKAQEWINRQLADAIAKTAELAA